MPLLPKPYSAGGAELPISGGRRAAADDFSGGDLGNAGAKVQQFALNYLQETEEKEARKALVSAADIRAKYARELDAAAVDGRDLGKLKEQMQDELGKVGAEFQTKKGSDSLALHQSNSELMFDEQANRISVQRAAADAERSGSQFLNSQAAVLRSDPTALARAEEDAVALVATFSRLPAHLRSKVEDGLKKELNMAAAIASARMNPEDTKKRLDAGEWNLSPEQREMAVGKADSEIRAKRAEETYQRTLKEYEEGERDGKARDRHFAGIIGGTASRRAIMDDADLQPATREHLIVFMEQRAKALAGQEKASDTVTKKELWLAIHAPDGDPKKIYNADRIFEAVKAGKLNTTDANQLNSLVAAQKDEQGRAFGTRLYGRTKTVEAAMRNSPEYQYQPELAAAIQLELVSQVERKAAALRKEGKDPSVLIDDPEHKDYMFKPGIIKRVADDVKRRQMDALPKPPVIATQEEYDALDDGTIYVDSTGRQATKRGKKKVPTASTFTPSGEKAPRDTPMTLATYKYRKAANLPIDPGLTVVDENGRVVPTEELP